MKWERVFFSSLFLAACAARSDVVCTDQGTCFAIDPEKKTLTLDEKTVQKIFAGQKPKTNAGDGVNAIVRYGASISDLEACRQAFIKVNGGNEFQPRQVVKIPQQSVCGIVMEVGVEPQKPPEGLSFWQWLQILSSLCCASGLLGVYGFFKMAAVAASEATEPTRRSSNTSSNGTYDGWIGGEAEETPIKLPPGVSRGTGPFPAGWSGRSEIEIGSLGSDLRRGGATAEKAAQMVDAARTAADQVRTVNGASHMKAFIVADEGGNPLGIGLDASGLTQTGRDILQNHAQNIINNAKDGWTVDDPPSGSLK